ncbi:hypothetical protein [Roseovarius pacificus]|uniref:hypothetical protein n=1 Tax=Roseovarius pacificus TaxID=337701 RepID=UPI002A18D750|nr:hypothetical protein [Roseovarius pacificus]
MDIWDATGTYTVFAFLNLISGYLMARFFWFHRLHIIFRLSVWCILVCAGVFILWVLTGIAVHLVGGELGHVFNAARGDVFLFLRYITSVGFEAGMLAILGAGGWLVGALWCYVENLYQNRHEPGGILNRKRVAKRWRVSYFLSGVWMLMMFLYAMVSDMYGSYLDNRELMNMIFMMVAPPLLALTLFWIYERFVK